MPVHLTIAITSPLLRLALEALSQARGPIEGRRFAHHLVSFLSVHIGVNPVPYNGGNFTGRHCHTIAARCADNADALRPFVSAPCLAEYERSWMLWRQILTSFNRYALMTPVQQAHFKADSRSFVSILQKPFPWLRISPKLHVLFAHSWDVMGVAVALNRMWIYFVSSRKTLDLACLLI